VFRFLVALIPAAMLAQPLAGTRPLEESGDFALKMIEGIHQYLNLVPARSGSAGQALGIAEPRVNPVTMELVGTTTRPALIHQAPGYRVEAVRWQAVEGLYGEGLLLQPDGPPKARVIALTGQLTPTLLARAAAGDQIVVPLRVDPPASLAAIPKFKVSPREFIYRMAFPLGRHPVGMDLQRILAVVDWFDSQDRVPIRIAADMPAEVEMAGIAASLDTRIEIGLRFYAGPVHVPAVRDRKVEDNVWNWTPPTRATLHWTEPAQPDATRFPTVRIPPDLPFRGYLRNTVDYLQKLVRRSPAERGKFWASADRSSAAAWRRSTQTYRDYFWNEVIGRLPDPSARANPRSRLLYETDNLRGYEVMLDVHHMVFAYGILLVPKNIREGERRPVVVCQHGLEGRPRDVADPAHANPTYNQFAVKLAELGYVTFSPQNPYTGGDRFRQIQLKANPRKLSIFSFVLSQHQRILEWLGEQPFADRDRIGFYGLSYGGYTAMRVPALLDGYALSICSGNFNEWVWKTATLDAPFTYPFHPDYEIVEWNFANTFNYSELASLIFPRPFFVERGHNDGVAYDEWVAYEYAKVRRFYDQMGFGDRTGIEYFSGGHVIHGKGSFEFLKRHLPLP
jgi:hypothetical protein